MAGGDRQGHHGPCSDLSVDAVVCSSGSSGSAGYLWCCFGDCLFMEEPGRVPLSCRGLGLDHTAQNADEWSGPSVFECHKSTWASRWASISALPSVKMPLKSGKKIPEPKHLLHYRHQNHFEVCSWSTGYSGLVTEIFLTVSSVDLS